MAVVVEMSTPAGAVPSLLGLTVHNGAATLRIEICDLARFVQAVADGPRLIFFDVGTAFWAIEHQLRQHNCEEARRAWWSMADRNRFGDVQILDRLVRLAQEGTPGIPCSLAAMASRYPHLAAPSVASLESQAALTSSIYPAVRRNASELVAAFRRTSQDIRTDAIEKFGVLTEAVQIKKAIGLAFVQREGVRIDQTLHTQLRQRFLDEMHEAATVLETLAPQIFDRDRRGRLHRPSPTAFGQICPHALNAMLRGVLNDIELRSGIRPDVPVDCNGTLSKDWSAFRGEFPWIGALLRGQEACRHFQECKALAGDRVYPTYDLLSVTGRVSTSSPDIQGIPHASGLRNLIVPKPGCRLLAVDITCAELRALAAHLLHRYGQSRLADVLKAGIDPHVHTAAMMCGVDVETFSAWRTDERIERGEQLSARFARMRTAAKAVNFGVPAGMGTKALMDHARKKYEIELSESNAHGLRQRLIGEVYPELSRFLQEEGHPGDPPLRAVATLTGRIRGNVGFTQARNTTFQGLAADGSALALFRLVLEGYRIVAWIHDELLVELPIETAAQDIEVVKRIICQEAARVLVGDIPVECTSRLGDCWGT